jgi:hypothetical protein
VIWNKALLCLRVGCWVSTLSYRYHPFYSTQLKLPNNHSINMLIVTILKKTTIFKINPFHHKTMGVTDIIISSKSRIKKMIQNTKKRKETGNTLTLKESNPHSKDSEFMNFDLSSNLPIIIILGTTKEIKKYVIINHI